MTYAAKILADSMSPDGVRLTTMEVTFPRIVLAEFNTHRMFSRNSASSRAIPVKKMIERVMTSPYIPSSWGKNQKGMQAHEELNDQYGYLKKSWLEGRDDAVNAARNLLEAGVHKQLTNRLLEPFMWHTCIVTATEWSNFFHLRNHKDAHPDIQIPAKIMQDLYELNEPKRVDFGEWHLPLIFDEDWDIALTMFDHQPTRAGLYPMMVKISVARCARVSYLTHDGKRDLTADLELHDRLLSSGHMSPLEHAAKPLDRGGAENAFVGNFRGWMQYRKTIVGESDMLGSR